MTFQSFAQKSLLQAGPMTGYSSMREVKVWVQTKEAAQVHISYWESGKKGNAAETPPILTNKQKAFTAHIPVALLEPGKKYEYQLYINGKACKIDYPLQFQTQTLWQWRADPPNFSFALGSCTYVNEDPYDRPGKPYGANYEIFTAIYEKNPDFMLWLGDNTYLREVDWDSRSGILHRYTHTRSLKEMQPLLGSTHNYALWDDHDYGPNNAERSYAFKETTLEAFKLFWANPNYELGPGGTIGTFKWQDVDFFLLDNRYFRNRNEHANEASTILGQAQINWLLDALKFSNASFKFIVMGGQFINPVAVDETYATVGSERQYIIDQIRKMHIKGVVFISGDRHFSELSVLQENEKVYPLYDFTVSPLTSGPYLPEKENNYLRVAETLFAERNFGMVQVEGERNKRKLTMQIFDVKGKQIWERSVLQEDLR
ncbi:MAG: alkaline phosphatase D family protein [Bacteroidota bacterium]